MAVRVHSLLKTEQVRQLRHRAARNTAQLPCFTCDITAWPPRAQQRRSRSVTSPWKPHQPAAAEHRGRNEHQRHDAALPPFRPSPRAAISLSVGFYTARSDQSLSGGGPFAQASERRYPPTAASDRRAHRGQGTTDRTVSACRTISWDAPPEDRRVRSPPSRLAQTRRPCRGGPTRCDQQSRKTMGQAERDRRGVCSRSRSIGTAHHVCRSADTKPSLRWFPPQTRTEAAGR